MAQPIELRTVSMDVFDVRKIERGDFVRFTRNGIPLVPRNYWLSAIIQDVGDQEIIVLDQNANKVRILAKDVVEGNVEVVIIKEENQDVDAN